MFFGKRQAEQAQEKLAILKAAVNIGDSIIWEYDVETDTLLVDYELNSLDGKLRPSRLKVEPFRNKQDFLNIIHPDDRQNVFYDPFERLIKGEIGSYTIQYRRLFGDEVIWVEANVQPYKYKPDGTPSRIVYYLSDITEQKLFQDKLYKVENKYRKIIPDLILSVDRDTRILRCYTDMELFCQQGLGIRLRAVAEESFPNEVASMLIKLVHGVFDEKREKEVSFSLNLKGTTRHYYCQVIPYDESEVLVISRDVTDHMRSRREADGLNELMGTITLSYQRMPKEVLISVRDTGIGIPEKDIDTIFERFVKLDTYQQGTGLGLAICKMLVDRLGGKIGVDSEEGIGSIFWFTLPLGKAPVEKPLLEIPAGNEHQASPALTAEDASSSGGVPDISASSSSENSRTVSGIGETSPSKPTNSMMLPSIPPQKQTILIADDPNGDSLYLSLQKKSHHSPRYLKRNPPHPDGMYPISCDASQKLFSY